MNFLKLDTGRKLLLNLRNSFLQAINHLDGVFVLGFLNREQQGARAVVKRQILRFLRAIGDAGELADRDRRARFARHDDLGKILRALHTRLNLHHALLSQRAHRAHRQILIFAADRAGHLFAADAISLQRLGIEIDIDFAFGGTHQSHRAYTAHVFQAFFQILVSPVGQFDRRHSLALRAVGNHCDRPH